MDNDLCQLVNKPTRSNNILDLAFVKESDDLVKCDIMPKLIASVDECLQISFLCNECTSKLINNNFTFKYDFTKGNYVALNNSLLSINWYYHFSLCENIHDMLKFFFDTAGESINLFIP